MPDSHCPCCGSEDVQITKRTKTHYFLSEPFSYEGTDYKCNSCTEEWLEDDNEFDIARNKLIDSMWDNYQYDVDVARFFGLYYSELKPKVDSIREKALILALAYNYEFRTLR